MATNQTHEQELLYRLQDGDQSAFGGVFHRFTPLYTSLP